MLVILEALTVLKKVLHAQAADLRFWGLRASTNSDSPDLPKAFT